MYSKAEASTLRDAFWTAFGSYMAPVLSAEGEKINWVNYKTGNKGFAFRMEAGTAEASVWVELTNLHEVLRAELYALMVEHKSRFTHWLGDGWHWQPVSVDAQGRQRSVIRKTLAGVSVLKKEDWPDLISFLKTSVIGWDAFWCEVKFSFDL